MSAQLLGRTDGLKRVVPHALFPAWSRKNAGSSLIRRFFSSHRSKLPLADLPDLRSLWFIRSKRINQVGEHGSPRIFPAFHAEKKWRCVLHRKGGSE